MFKPFYIHRQMPHWSVTEHRSRAFTAYVTPCQDEKTVCVQLTFCSSKDHFCRKTGRQTVVTKEKVVINRRQLPAYLNEAEKHMYRIKSKTFNGNWEWVFKYFM